MRILFLTLMRIRTLSDEGIYMDLMREFVKEGHEVLIVSPLEKKEGRETEHLSEGAFNLIRCRTGDLFGVGRFKKAISQSLIPFQYKRAIDSFLKKEGSRRNFDLILYSTPPISIAALVKKLKKRMRAVTYLMLKDIFPQNAVDLKLISPFLAKMIFRRKEKELYQISDFIGCMSFANVEYLLKHNELNEKKVGLCPNSISLREDALKKKENLPEKKVLKEKKQKRAQLANRYGFDEKKLLYLYGGNLGLPQDIPFLLSCIDQMKEDEEIHFIICGDGGEAHRIKTFLEEKKPKNLTLLPALAKREYEELAHICDVGMIFLDYRFTIPNFPSRLLSYMEAELPVLVCTDEATDMGKIAEDNDFGLFAPSNSSFSFRKQAESLKDGVMRERLGKNARKYLEEHYTAEKSARAIMDAVFYLKEIKREGGI